MECIAPQSIFLLEKGNRIHNVFFLLYMHDIVHDSGFLVTGTASLCFGDYFVTVPLSLTHLINIVFIHISSSRLTIPYTLN